jgi:hypothetical protein
MSSEYEVQSGSGDSRPDFDERVHANQRPCSVDDYSWQNNGGEAPHSKISWKKDAMHGRDEHEIECRSERIMHCAYGRGSEMSSSGHDFRTTEITCKCSPFRRRRHLHHARHAMTLQEWRRSRELPQR